MPKSPKAPAFGTLLERTSRFRILRHVGEGRRDSLTQGDRMRSRYRAIAVPGVEVTAQDRRISGSTSSVRPHLTPRPSPPTSTPTSNLTHTTSTGNEGTC